MAKRYNGAINIDLTAKGEQKYRIPASDRLWLAEWILRGDVIFQNPKDCAVAIRFSEDSEKDVWGLQNGLRNSESGPFTQILATVLVQGAGTMLCMMTGLGINGGYCNADGLSPTIGGSPAPNTTDLIVTRFPG